MIPDLLKLEKKATVKISRKNTLEKQAYGEKHERKKYMIYVVINLYSMLFVRWLCLAEIRVAI